MYLKRIFILITLGVFSLITPLINSVSAQENKTEDFILTNDGETIKMPGKIYLKTNLVKYFYGFT